jgi:Glycosyl hydrolase catalytic core
MVPATMGRKAMVAVLCAVAVCPFAVLMSTSTARADEPVPLGQVQPNDAQSTDAQSTDSADPSTSAEDWSGADWTGHGSSPDDSSGSGTADEGAPGDAPAPDDGSWCDWLDDASSSNWTWDSWFWDEGATSPSSDATQPEPAATDPPTADDPSSTSDPGTANTLLAAVTTLATDVLAAPTMSASSTTVSWTPTSGVSSYVFVRKVPGQAAQYSIVNGTSVTPPTVPGQTVSYGVRTNVGGSAWASEVSISYLQSSPTPPTVDPTTAPTMSVSGSTVKWTAIPSASSYVFVRKVPGQAAQYSIVSSTSVTPPAVPGQTVSYGVRANVSASAWASEVSISYPGTTQQTPPPTTTPTPTPTPTPQPINGSFQMGIVGGSSLSYELSFLKSLGAHTARIEYGIGTSASSMASVIDAYAKAGIRPLLLAGFNNRLPTTAEAQNLGSWAAAYGPGGTFWQGKSYPANTAVTDIEFGNETAYSYQFSDNSVSTYASRAQTYALRARDAANAIRSANAKVGLLAQGDNAVNGTTWMTNLLKAAPTLDDLVAGWTIHPYGPNWATRIDSTINSAKAAGARDLPIWVTEWGLSTDNGRCLSDNYGFSKCMSYSSAASTLNSVLSGMQSRYGSRLGGFFLYQAHDQYPSGSQTGREAYFGALQSNGSAKGAYTTEVKGDLAAN